MVRALSFHHCSWGSIPRLGFMCEMSLLVLYSAPRGFSPRSLVFLFPRKPSHELIFVVFKLIWFLYPSATRLYTQIKLNFIIKSIVPLLLRITEVI